MRVGEALREAWRDIASGAGRPVTFALLFAVAVGGIVLASAVSTAAAVREARDFIASGAAVYVMKASARIDGSACDALGSLANVTAAGAIREESEGIASARLPRTPISLFLVSRGFTAMLPASGDPSSGGLSLSRDAAETVGAESGQSLDTTRGATRVASVFDYPDDGRDPLLAFAATAPTDNGAAFDQCWASIWPHDENAVAALGRTVLSDGGEQVDRPVLMQLNQTHGSRFVATTVLDRSTAGSLAIVAGGVIGVAFVLRRRLALASDRHIGVGRLAQVVSQSTQVLLGASIGSAATLAAVLITVRSASEDRLPVVLQSVTLLVAGGGAAVAACAITVCLLRESALFRYFKQR